MANSRKNTRKKKLRLKKSVRWGIAGVLMATALIVALIPVQNGGVSATTNYNTQGPFAVTPALDEIVTPTADYEGGKSMFNYADLSIVPTTLSVSGNGIWGFPLKMVSDGYTPSEYVTNGTERNNNVVLRIPADSSTDELHKYNVRDYAGNLITTPNFKYGDEFYIMSDNLPSVEGKKYIYELGMYSGSTNPNTVYRYKGVENVYQCNGAVPMADGSIGYNTPETGYQFRNIEVITYDWEDPEDHSKGKKEIKRENFNVCTNSATIEYIADDAFASDEVGNATNIVTITLPGTIKKIGNNAFDGQGYLREIYGGEFLTEIGQKAFYNCASLQKVSFASNCPLKVIGDGAFAQDGSLIDFPIPGLIEQIGSGAFYNCVNLNDGNGDMESESQSNIFQRTKENGNTIKLGNYVFAKCLGLKNIALDKDISQMGKGTFADCEVLSTVVMPEKVDKNYSADTFANVHNMKYVRVPESDVYRRFCNSSGDNLTDYPCIFITTTNQEQNSKDIDPTDPNPNPDLLEQITMNNELFALWGPKTSVKSAIHTYAQKYGICYMFRGDDGLIHYETTSNGYTFEFSEKGVLLGCTPLDTPEVKAGETLKIPSSIGGVNIIEIKDSCFENMHPTADGYPVAVSLPDSVKKIGKNAFKNCANIELVKIETGGVDILDGAFSENDKLRNVMFTQTSELGDSTIGANCFLNDEKLEMVSFRNTGITQDNINVVNVKSIGKDAFKTGNDKGIVIQGDMRAGYVPYEFAINPDNRTSTGLDSYITYQTGNPDNLKCRYDKEIEKVSLLTYPCSDTKVGEAMNSGGTLEPVTIHNLEEKLASYYANNANPMPSVMEQYILDRYKNIIIPAGIETIEKARADANSTQGIKMLRDLNEEEGETYTVNGKEVACNNTHALNTLQFGDIKEIPNDSCRNDDNLTTVIINGQIDKIGKRAFYDCDRLARVEIGSLSVDGNPLPIKKIDEYAFGSCEELKVVTIHGNVTDPDLPGNTFYECDSLTDVVFEGENPKDTASKSDPYYWCEDGIIYKDDGEKVYLVECLPGVQNVTPIAEIDEIMPRAFENCDKLDTVDFSNCEKITEVPEGCFYDCDVLESVILPKACSSIGKNAFDCDPENTLARSTKLDVTMLAHEIYVSSSAFENRINPVEGGKALNTVHSYDATAAQRYAKDMPNVNFEADVKEDVLIRFVYYVDNEVVIEEVTVPYGTVPIAPDVPVDGRKGYKYVGYWDSQILEAVGFKEYRAVYEPDSTSGSSKTDTSSTKKSSSSKSSSSSSKSSSGSSGSSGSSSSSTSGSGSGSGSSSAQPVVISGAPAPVGQIISNAPGAASTATTGTVDAKEPSNKVSTGNTNVVNSTPGISDSGKMSATVNGSSDNYVIKISETTEAEDMAKAALSANFGSLDNIRYMPFDISLYDSTGTQKISPVPEGVTVSVTMPIPDDLTIYGGNNKVASTTGGVLEPLQPRFTVIDGVPCMNFTVSHLSPYVIYVDTANLTDSGILDATPKTGDPIHPKWFLCIGLACVSIILFLKRDKEFVKTAN